MHTGPYLCLYQTLTKYFKPHTHEFGLEIHSEEVIRKQLQQRLSFLHVTHILVITNASTKHYQNMSKVSKLWRAQDFGFKGDNYTTKKKERVVSLAGDMPTGPSLHFYQILSYYLKQYASYGLHKILLPGR